jgi:hypothetical protein
MNIKSETINGVTRYFINGNTYERIEDVPEEYKKYFQDKDDNGIPDHIDEVFTGKGAGLGSLFSVFKDTVASSMRDQGEQVSETINQPAKTSVDRYNRMSGESSALPTLIKIGFGIVIGIAIAWYSIKNLGSGTTPESPHETRTVTTEEGSDDDNINGDENNSEPVAEIDPNALVLEINDPNEPPYGMYVAVVQNKLDVFRFDMPDGELVESGSNLLTVRMKTDEKKNLSSKVFRVTVDPGKCNLVPITDAGGEFNKTKLGDNIFDYGVTNDSGAGHSVTTHYYSFVVNNYCVSFSLELVAVNANNFDPPLEQFNEGQQVAELETMLTNLVWK